MGEVVEFRGWASRPGPEGLAEAVREMDFRLWADSIVFARDPEGPFGRALSRLGDEAAVMAFMATEGSFPSLVRLRTAWKIVLDFVQADEPCVSGAFGRDEVYEAFALASAVLADDASYEGIRFPLLPDEKVRLSAGLPFMVSGWERRKARRPPPSGDEDRHEASVAGSRVRTRPVIVSVPA